MSLGHYRTLDDDTKMKNDITLDVDMIFGDNITLDYEYDFGLT